MAKINIGLGSLKVRGKCAVKGSPATSCMQLCGTMAKGLAAATLDGEYLARFRARPLTYRGRLMAGVQAAAVGVYEGFVGTRHVVVYESAQCGYFQNVIDDTVLLHPRS